MGDWLLNLPLPEMALLVFVAVFLVGAAVYFAVIGLAVDARGRAFKALAAAARHHLRSSRRLCRRPGLKRFRPRQARRRDRGERPSRHRYPRREPPGRAEGTLTPAGQSPYRASGNAGMGIHGETAPDDGNHADPSHRGPENHPRLTARR